MSGRRTGICLVVHRQSDRMMFICRMPDNQVVHIVVTQFSTHDVYLSTLVPGSFVAGQCRMHGEPMHSLKTHSSTHVRYIPCSLVRVRYNSLN